MKHTKTFLSYFLFTFALLIGFYFTQAQTTLASEPNTLVKSDDGTVYYIAEISKGEHYRVPFTSAGAFLSYGFLSFDQVKPMDAQDIAIPENEYFAMPKNGTVICATETKGTDVAGECSLISEGIKHAFASQKGLTSNGYSLSQVFYGDTSFLEKSNTVIEYKVAHKPGTLIKYEDEYRYIFNDIAYAPISNQEVLKSWGWNDTSAVQANDNDLELLPMPDLEERQPGVFNLTSEGIDALALESIIFATVVGKTKLPNSERHNDQSELNDIENQFKDSEELNFYDALNYFDADSKSVMNKLSVLSQDLSAAEDKLARTTVQELDSYVAAGGNVAIIDALEIQSETKYRKELRAYFKKENAEWKLNFLASVKDVWNSLEGQEPVEGGGKTDLRLVSAKVNELSLDSEKNSMEIRLKNIGKTTINQYFIYATIGEYELVKPGDSSTSYSLKPNQEIILNIRLQDIIDMNILYGNQELEITVLDGALADQKLENNSIKLKHNIK